MLGALIALTLPALGGYDESVHFLRAWQISDGGVFSTERTNADGTTVYGGDVPDELVADLVMLLRTGVFEEDGAAAWRRLGDDEPDGPRSFVEFSSAAVYPPVPYLPSALALRAGRTFGLSTLALVLLARLADLAAFVAIVGLAIRRLPGRRWSLAALSLLPVVVFQAATVSADAITAALAMLVAAYAVALNERPRGEVGRRKLAECAVATVALALAKQPYVLVAALLVVPAWRHRGRVGAALGAALASAAALATAWSVWAAARHVPQDFAPAYLDRSGNYAYRNVDPGAQFEFVRAHPWSFLAAIGRTIGHAGDEIGHDLFAQTTWWRVPWPLVVVAAAAVVALALLDATPVPARAMRASAAAVAAVLTVVIFFLAYSGWNAVEAPRIDAFQGRYLFPALAVALVIAVPGRWARRSTAHRLGPVVAGGLAGLLALVELGLLRTFYF